MRRKVPNGSNKGGARPNAGRKQPSLYRNKYCLAVSDNQQAHLEQRADKLSLTVPAFVRMLIDADIKTEEELEEK